MFIQNDQNFSSIYQNSFFEQPESCDHNIPVNNDFTEFAENPFATEPPEEAVFNPVDCEQSEIEPINPSFEDSSNNESKKRKRDLEDQGVAAFANKHLKKRAKLEIDDHDDNNKDIISDEELTLMESIKLHAGINLLDSEDGKAIKFELKGLPFITIWPNYDDDPTIFLWQGKVVKEGNSDFLGNGAFGVAQKVYDVTSETLKAIKIANSALYPDLAAKELQREFQTINTLNGENIQKTPELFIENLLHNQPAMIMDLYSGDLSQFEYQKLTTKKKLPLLVQVFIGIRMIHRTHIHGDIKAKNTLVLDPKDESSNHQVFIADLAKDPQDESSSPNVFIADLAKDPEDESSSHQVFIADLAGAKKICDYDEDFFANTSYIGTTFTRGYLTEGDDTKLAEAFRSQNKEEWVHLQKKRDIFAGALTACHLLTGFEYTYESKTTFPKTIENIEQSLKPLIGQSTIDILVQALNEDPLKRPEIGQIIDALQKEANAPSIDELIDLFTPASYELPEFTKSYTPSQADPEPSSPLQLIFSSKDQSNSAFTFLPTREKKLSKFAGFAFSNLELNSSFLD